VVAIQWPLNTAPGKSAQDGAGRLINVFPEDRQNGQGMVWRRVPGAIKFTTIYPQPASMTGTVTVTFVGVNRQAAVPFTGTITALFVGST
jgi:hypothetical protein